MPARVGSRLSGQRTAAAFQKVECRRHYQHIHALLVSGVCLVSAVIGLSLSAAAQSDTTTAELDTYRTAISASTMSERDSGLNALIARYPASTLRNDALAILAWDHYRTGRRDDAIRDATALRNRDANNPLAVAIMLALTPVSAQDGEHAHEQQFSRARAALDGLRQLRRPTGMGDIEFRALSQQVTAILAGFVGHEELASKQYTAAREHLRMAAAAAPDHPPYSYELALADLSGHKTNESEAFWYLARAVVLSRGTAAGQEVAAFAAARYREAGGTNNDWQKFLAAAAGSSGPKITLASAKPTTTTRAVPTERALKASSNQPAATKHPELDALGATTAAANAGAWKPASHAPLTKPGEPFSLGILIEASALQHSTRAALVQGLSEIARNLRPSDEAFILSFSDTLDFQQDLTDDYHLLENAVDQIHPQRGSALLDAVSFAAAHLKRIAKNKYRVLLVVSDGDTDAVQSAMPLSSAVNELRIYCIGLGIDDQNHRSTLETLASRTGGGASFIESPEQFEMATLRVAQQIYRGQPF